MRKNKKNKDIEKFELVEKLVKNHNKKAFWSKIKNHNNRMNGKTNVNINIDLLEKHYFNIFSIDEEDNLNEFQKNVKKGVINYENSINIQEIYKNEIVIPDVKLAFKESKNSKSKGFDGLSPYLFNKSICNKEIENICIMFNLILKTGVFPKNFNLSIIKPIVKNNEKSNQDINNIRPISVSNALSQLFELIILNKNYSNFMTSENQFGLKQNPSCKLALFPLRETIINYIEKNSCCYLVSLDAEKAFDKLWRDGLFYKLINKLDKHYWFIKLN